MNFEMQFILLHSKQQNNRTKTPNKSKTINYNYNQKTTGSSFGDRAFAAAGPVLWNSLPTHLKEADLPYSQFRRSLKTFLFG